MGPAGAKTGTQAGAITMTSAFSHANAAASVGPALWLPLDDGAFLGALRSASQQQPRTVYWTR